MMMMDRRRCRCRWCRRWCRRHAGCRFRRLLLLCLVSLDSFIFVSSSCTYPEN